MEEDKIEKLEKEIAELKKMVSILLKDQNRQYDILPKYDFGLNGLNDFNNLNR